MVGRVGDWLIAGVFGAWFVATVAHQFDSIREKAVIRSFDPLGLVPIWTFFAPRPGMSDYHLIYRQVSPAEPLSEWTEIPLVNARHWSHIVWNPHRRRSKVVTDCMHAVGSQVRDAREDVIESSALQRRLLVSIPYLTLLSMVMSHDSADLSTGAYRQFAIVERRGIESATTTVVLCSTLHPCRKADANGAPVGA